MRKQFIFLCILSIWLQHMQAQNFTFKAKVQPVTQKAFYRINLNSDLSARSKTSYDDVRLFDQKGKEIPFLLKSNPSNEQSSHFIEYPIISKETNDSDQTLIIENVGAHKIGSLQIKMKQADANRAISISGSQDQQTWYVVKDHFNFSPNILYHQSEVIQTIQFPETDYQYYKISIHLGKQEALNILQIGYLKDSNSKPSYQLVHGLTYTRKDSNKQSILTFTCKPSNSIDYLAFKISSPKLFMRKATLYKEFHEKPSKNTNITYTTKRLLEQNHETFELNSTWQNFYETSYFLGKEHQTQFTILIDNDDNEPLQFESIQAYQLNSHLIAELQPGISYYLYFGDSLLEKPTYDLVYFENEISDTIQQIGIEKIQPKASKNEDEFSNTNDKLFVWLGLIIVGIILFILTTQMIKKINFQEQ